MTPATRASAGGGHAGLAVPPWRAWAYTLVAAAPLLFLPSGVRSQSPPELPLGPADVVLEERFSRVVAVRELSRGRVLVADRQERFLYAVDLSSTEVTILGRHGDGPGEYQNPGLLFPLAGDTTLFTDFSTRRWFVVDGDHIIRTIGGHRPAPDRFGPNLSGGDASGRVLGVEGIGVERLLADSVRVVVADGWIEGELRGETVLGHLPGPGRLGRRVTVTTTERGRFASDRRSPLATEGQAWMFSDGWIALAWDEPYRVDWRTPGGEWVRGDPLPMQHVAVTHEEQCHAIHNLGLEECDLEVLPDWPERIPPFLLDALIPAPNGSLFIRRTSSISSPTPRYDVVDRTGTLIGTLRLGEGERIVGSGAESVYVVETGALGLQTLRRHPWP